MKLVTADCTCSVNTPYQDGTIPLFVDTESDAVRAFRLARATKTFWGIHLNGVHIVAIKPQTP